jgi:methyl-accepting chemotaxis protein/ABC-type amino acid transport substrate-binding protein
MEKSMKNKILILIICVLVGFFAIINLLDLVVPDDTQLNLILDCCALLAVIVAAHRYLNNKTGIVCVTDNLINQAHKNKADLAVFEKAEFHACTDPLAIKFIGFINGLATALIKVKKVVKDSEDIGKLLIKNSEKLLSFSAKIFQSSNSINQKSENLNREVENSQQSIKDIVEFLHDLQKDIASQNSSVEDCSASIEEMVASIENISRIIRDKKTLSDQLLDLAKISEQDMLKTDQSFEMIKQSTSLIQNMSELIDDITAQTNILSMNASIEAAHAGSSGKGFSVVAIEIRKLAVESSQNAKNISDSVAIILEQISNTAEFNAKLTQSITRLIAGIEDVIRSMDETQQSIEVLSTGSQEIIAELNELVMLTQKVRSSSKAVISQTVLIQNVMEKIYGLSDENKNEVVNITTQMNSITNSIEALSTLGRSSTKFTGMLTELLDHYEISDTQTKAQLLLVSAPFPPYHYESGGDVKGLDIELFNRIFDRMQKRFKVEFLPWDDCIALVQEKKADMIFALNRTRERENFLYYPKEHNALSESVFFIKKGSQHQYDTWEDLRGVKIGVVDGYSYSGRFMDVQFLKRVPAKSNETNFVRLDQGTIDMLICDKLVGIYLAKKIGVFENITFLPKAVNQSLLYVGFSQKPENETIADAYSKILTAMKKSGEYDQIIDRLLYS